MKGTIAQWLSQKWLREEQPTLAESYRLAFSTGHGERVFRHLLDTIYCSIYEGENPHMALAHNARRSVVHEILENIDLAERPPKPTETEASYAPAR